jgi:putative FmdB family regulatory protein
MPTYDYICKDCLYEFEEFQKMSDPLLKVCPKCSGTLERKIGGGAGLLFKGNGFYITDYKKSSSPAISSKEESKETKKPEEKKKPKKTDNS